MYLYTRNSSPKYGYSGKVLGYGLEDLIGLDIFHSGRKRKSVVRVRSSLCVCVGADVPWPWVAMLPFWDWCKT